MLKEGKAHFSLPDGLPGCVELSGHMEWFGTVDGLPINPSVQV